mgnify:CR=1 FL=1
MAKEILKKKQIKLFTAYHSKDSRRGYGFDKPEKDNVTREEPYPSLMASPQTFWTYRFYRHLCVG